MEYAIVGADDQHVLQDKVNHRLSEGWQLLGGPVVYFAQEACPPGLCWAQAMTHNGEAISRERVGTLQRIGPSQNDGYYYYSPDGHCVGPFDTHQKREDAIKARYEEGR